MLGDRLKSDIAVVMNKVFKAGDSELASYILICKAKDSFRRYGATRPILGSDEFLISLHLVYIPMIP